MDRPVVTIWALTAAVTLVTIGLIAGPVHQLPTPETSIQLSWWSLAALFFVAEVSVVHLRFHRNAHSFSLSEIPLVLGLFFASPLALIAGQQVGSLAALVVVRRQAPIKVIFNLALFSFQSCLVLLTFHAFTEDRWSLGVHAWTSALAAVLASTLLGTLLISLAIRFAEGALSFRSRLEVLQVGVVSAISNCCLALVGVTILTRQPQAIFLLAIPTAALFGAYRIYTEERERHEDLSLLFESSQALQAADDLDSAVRALLGNVARIFRADLAELVLFPLEDEVVGLRTSLEHAAESELMSPLNAAQTFECLQLATVGPHLVRSVSTQMAYLSTRGCRDALVVPVRGQQRTLGVLIAGNGPPRIGAFKRNHLRLLETLAGQLSVVLARSRLEKELRRRAFQDPLTNLATRAFFAQRIEQALGDRRRRRLRPAVLLVDLDDFSVVNDTLGLGAGDELLTSVAERLRACIRPIDVAARLGGDEFGILIERTTREEAARLAQRIEDSLRVPFRLAGGDASVRASVGVALADPGLRSAEELIRNADAALYTAKHRGKGQHAVFDAQMREAVLGRYSLIADLNLALAGPQLVVRYQPIFDLAKAELAGVEALVRWQHPELGLLTPDRFIALAEESNLIQALDLLVLKQACMQMKAWSDSSSECEDLYVSVNLSRAHLRDPRLFEMIAKLLDEVGLAPSRLVLEITESAVVGDLPGALEKLVPLRQHGIRIAIDDFGTGYSSLSALNQMPIDMLKLAKPIVDQAADGGRGEAVIRAVTALAQALSLQTVAEGIESAEQLAVLRALGCEYGQGYYMAQPLDADSVDALLVGHRLRLAPKIQIAG